MQIVDKIISNFTKNKSLYIGEKVTMSEHMIQTAMLAEKAKCDDNLICSSLLHDYGHFILENPDELVELDMDEARKLIQCLKGRNVIGGDVACLMPTKDSPNQITAMVAASIMFEIICLISVYRNKQF